jgi:hypothetical protein
MTSPTADPSECIAHAPVAWRVQCKVLRERERLMGRNADTRNARQEFGESCGGKSIRELMEDRLDDIIDEVMALGDDEPAPEDWKLKGEGRGVAWCIALILQPYNPDVDDVMNDAMLRYEARLEEGADEPATAR